MPKEKKISVIDIGGNSTVLLVAECDNMNIEPVNEVYAVTRLCEGLDETGMLSSKSMELTLTALKEMKKISDYEGADELVVTVSSVIKKAGNRSEFLVRCHNELNIFPQVLSPTDEARYSFLGSVYDLKDDGPMIAIDVGGGDTQIAYGTKNIMVGAHSLNIGCVSLNAKFKLSEGAWIHNWLSAKMHIKKCLFSCVDDVNSWMMGRTPCVIASGGTATVYAAVLMKQNIYDRKHINSTKSYLKEVSATSRQISRTPLGKRRKFIGLDETRAEVLPAGLLILSTVLKFFRLDEFRISANGLRFGIIRNYLKS